MIPFNFRNFNQRRLEYLRSLKLKFAKLLFDHSFLDPNVGEKNPTLVLRLDGKLGDSIVSTGFLRELKSQRPTAPLLVVTNGTARQAYSGLSFIDEVIVKQKGLIASMRLFFKLRRLSYWAIINTSYILKPFDLFLMSHLKARHKVGWQTSDFKSFSQNIKIEFAKDHMTDIYRKTLEALGLTKGSSLNYELRLNSSSVFKAKNLLKQIRGKFDHVLVLNSFAGARLRNLNFATCKKLIEALAHRKIAVISIGNQGDQKILGEWMARAPHLKNWFVFKECTSFDDNLALINEADLIVTPDTAIVHAASALNKPLVALYREDLPGEYNSVTWAPVGARSQVVFSPNLREQRDINHFNMEKLIETTIGRLNDSTK